MNIFILNSGRCGSTTFIKACQHIDNYTSAHESLSTETGDRRLYYPKNHIEADNRLSWMLGRLDEKFGDDAYYVHLTRNENDVTTSFCKRLEFGILKAFEQGILMHDGHMLPARDIAADYLTTVDSNIRLFLKDKTRTMDASLENISIDFTTFWNNIGAKGNLDKALKEWQTSYNAS